MERVKGDVMAGTRMISALQEVFGVQDGVKLLLDHAIGTAAHGSEKDFRKIFVEEGLGERHPTLAVAVVVYVSPENNTAFVYSNQIGDGTCVAKIPFTVTE